MKLALITLGLLATSGIALMLLTGAANAGGMPKDLTGKWCFDDSVEKDRGLEYRVFKEDSGKTECAGEAGEPDQPLLVIRAKSYRNDDVGCSITKIRTYRNYHLPANTKEMGALSARVEAVCDDGERRFRETAVFSLVQADLWVRVVKHK